MKCSSTHFVLFLFTYALLSITHSLTQSLTHSHTDLPIICPSIHLSIQPVLNLFLIHFYLFFSSFHFSGAIVGANVSQYLLEKSRIVSQSDGERNYHVFYELLSGMTAEEKNGYSLTQAEDYPFLNQGRSQEVAEKNDAEDFNRMCTSMDVLGFDVCHCL